MRLIDADAIQIPSTYVDLFENCRNCKLLDREQVREIIDNTPTIEPKTKVIAQVTFDEEKMREIVKEAVERFKEEYEIEPKRGEWIPCSERLPDDSREVLISLEWGIDIGTYERGEWRSEWINHYDDDNVLAWMPLPKPWKGADDER